MNRTPNISKRSRFLLSASGLLAAGTLLNTAALANPPKVIVISLDGATPRLVKRYSDSGAMLPTQGLGLLQSKGIKANQNITITPSLTAAAHIAIATGSNASPNDVMANTFHLVASPFIRTISGFSAPIGGYSIDGPAETPFTTADPLWLALRAAGKKVATATFPGGDGLNVTVPGLTNSPIVQSASKRTVDYTVPFGAFAGVGGKGYVLNVSNFSPASSTVLSQLSAAGRVSYSPVMTANPGDTYTVGGVSYDIRVAALDTTNDGVTNYDTLVFFDSTLGIQTDAGLTPPHTGSAFVKASDAKSSPFYLEGSSNRAGLAYYVTILAGDLSTVHYVRYSADAIPRNAPVINDVDDINDNVGFWADQADFRFPERINPGLGSFTDAELEAIYEDQVKSFVIYQTKVALRAVAKIPDLDLLMVYIEQPDGSGHQFLITDPRQATDPTNPNSIFGGQDAAKIARYDNYLATAYKAANQAVQSLIDTVGVDASGKPKSDIIVVSDHGFDPFHTAVNLTAYLTAQGFDSSKVRAITSGPAANIYINLQGREPNGTVSRAEYLTLQQQLVTALQNLADTNPNYAPVGVKVFDKIYPRPALDITDPQFGRNTSEFVGQDGGDVLALLTTGYNFDGAQSPLVTRLGDTSAAVLSVPNFYGAHGYDPLIPDMSAIFYAAGPDIGTGTFPVVHNIDIAPTISKLLGVTPSPKVQGTALDLSPLTLTTAGSRRQQGANTFDVALPLTGTVGVESRQPDASGKFTVALTFSSNLASGTVNVTTGTGSVSNTTVNGKTLLVTLSGVTDAQTLTLTVSGLTDTLGKTLDSVSVKIGFLLGDVNGDGKVDASDLAQVKAAASPGTVTSGNFRNDINANGAINATDVALVKSRQGHHL